MDKKINSVHISSSGNLVSVIMDRNKKLLSVEVDDSLLDKSQKELLEEFIISTVNEAVEKVDEMNIELVEENNMFDIERRNKADSPFLGMNATADLDIKPSNIDMNMIKNMLDNVSPTMMKNMLDNISPTMMKNILDMMNKDKDNNDKK